MLNCPAYIIVRDETVPCAKESAHGPHLRGQPSPFHQAEIEATLPTGKTTWVSLIWEDQTLVGEQPTSPLS